jgi:hypothetical protein
MERCTSANVYTVTKGLKMNEPIVGTKMKSKSSDKRAVRPERDRGKGIREYPQRRSSVNGMGEVMPSYVMLWNNSSVQYRTK